MSERYLCVDCGKAMSDEEREYYEIRCEQCEGAAFHALEAAHFPPPAPGPVDGFDFKPSRDLS